MKAWQRLEWCIPSVSAEFVSAMEDVLDLDGEPYDPQRPTICSDETSIQFIGEGRVKLPPGGDSQRGLTLTITKDRQ